MNNKAPKFKLIQGGKKKDQPKVKLNLELFLVSGILLIDLGIILWCMYVNKI